MSKSIRMTAHGARRMRQRNFTPDLIGLVIQCGVRQEQGGGKCFWYLPQKKIKIKSGTCTHRKIPAIVGHESGDEIAVISVYWLAWNRFRSKQCRSNGCDRVAFLDVGQKIRKRRQTRK